MMNAENPKPPGGTRSYAGNGYGIIKGVSVILAAAAMAAGAMIIGYDAAVGIERPAKSQVATPVPAPGKGCPMGKLAFGPLSKQDAALPTGESKVGKDACGKCAEASASDADPKATEKHAAMHATQGCCSSKAR